jgi:hypothetical protein
MSLDSAAKNFEFNAALGIHGQNAGHRWVGSLTTNRDITACYRDKADACVNQSGHTRRSAVMSMKSTARSYVIEITPQPTHPAGAQGSESGRRNCGRAERQSAPKMPGSTIVNADCRRLLPKRIQPDEADQTSRDGSVDGEQVDHSSGTLPAPSVPRPPRPRCPERRTSRSSLRRLVDARGLHYSGPNHDNGTRSPRITKGLTQTVQPRDDLRPSDH